MPLGSAAHIDYELRNAGDPVVYGAQSGYGLLDSPGVDVTDDTHFRYRGYARVLALREGAFTGLTQDTLIKHAGITYTVRDIGNAGTDGLRRMIVTLGAHPPVDHLTITPSPASVLPNQNLQLAAAAFDAANNPLTDRVITWQSSDPTIATVSGSGLVRGIASGSAIITATSEGKTGNVTLTVLTFLAFVRSFVTGGDTGIIYIRHTDSSTIASGTVTEWPDLRGTSFSPSLFPDGTGLKVYNQNTPATRYFSSESGRKMKTAAGPQFNLNTKVRAVVACSSVSVPEGTGTDGLTSIAVAPVAGGDFLNSALLLTGAFSDVTLQGREGPFISAFLNDSG